MILFLIKMVLLTNKFNHLISLFNTLSLIVFVNTNQIKLKLKDNISLGREKKSVVTRLFLEMFTQDQNHI